MKINIHTHTPRLSEKTISTIGIHPFDAEGVSTDELFAVERNVTNFDAVGEIGLDFHCPIDREKQLLIFNSQLDIAQSYGKGVVLHCVKAFEPMMKILKGYTLPFVIFHGFIGSAVQAAKATERGYYLSFGERTFRSPKSIEAMRAINLDRLFLETDESDITIDEIYSRAATVLGIPEVILESITNENFNRICG